MPARPKLRLIPLGGLGEVGKNMMVVEYGADMFIIDAGLMFPEEEMLGIDLVIPDFTYLKENIGKIRAIVLTHGHEDHTGALPYVLKDIKVPVYGTRLTLGLVAVKLEEHHVDADLREINGESHLKLGPFKLEFMRVSHSVPDGLAIAIHTPVGLVIHTGDFKLDQTPIDGIVTEFDRLSHYRNKGVLALLSDSTNAELDGYTASEREVGDALGRIFASAKGRIIVASFASHIHRIQQVMDVARASKRKVAICGRTMESNVEIAAELGYLKIPPKLMIQPSEMKGFQPSQICVLSTGTQGEPLSALARMASREHRWVEVGEGDTVIISASPVPGNEKAISQTIDRLFRRGADVYYESISGVHVSGHGSREELRMMINMVGPKYFVPIHGEYRHLTYHARLAAEVGIPRRHIFVLECGDVLELSDGKARRGKQVRAGAVLVDGLGVGDIGDVVLRDRQVLASDGILIVVVTIGELDGRLLSDPELVTRGFVYVKESSELLEEAKARVVETLKRTAAEHVTDWGILKSDVRRVLSEFLYEKTRRRPMILPIIVEV